MLRRRTDGSLGNAIIWFGASYAATICGYLGLNAVAGRWLGPADFGQFVVVLTATGLLGQLGLVGVHRSGLRGAARLEGEDDRHALVRLRNGVRAVHLTTLPFVSALGVVGAWVLSAEETTPVRLTLSCSVGVLVLLTGQQKVWANYLRGFGHYRLASLVEGRSGGALVAVSQAGLALALWRLFPALGLAGVLGAVAAGYAIPVLAARQVVRAHWRHQPGDQAPQLIADMRAVIRRDWRFLSVQIAVFLNISVEVWIAALLLDAVDTSMYTAGLRLAQLLILPMTAIQVVFSPTIARLMVQEDRQRHVERILRTGATLASLLTVAVAVPMVVAPELVLDLVYGPGFGAAVPVLLLLLLGFVVNALMGLAGTTLSMSGLEGLSARVQWAGVVARVVLGTAAAFLGGVVALAAASTLVSAFVFTAMWWITRRRLGVSTHITARPSLGLLRSES
jgi:O-antigen/teichoic acid export membrane protein